MRFALALLDMMTAGVYAGALVEIARRRMFLRIPFEWLSAVLAQCFIFERIVLPENVYAAAVVAAFAVAAIGTALTLARTEPFGTLLVVIPAMVILTIVLADVYDPQAREPLRGLISPLLAVPSLGAITRLFYLYRKRNRTV